MKRRPLVMGILNITPDSFSGDGVMGQAALDAAARLADEGADVIDLGAESTRPGAMPLTADEELRRLMPVLEAVASVPWRQRVRISVDTRHAQTARVAMASGAEIVNDESGLGSPDMSDALAAGGADVVVMHSLGLPANPRQTLPKEVDVVAEILRWKEALAAQAAAHGISPQRLIFDPGIGFGKTAAQSLALMHAASELVASGGRWLIGHSRKSYLGLFTDQPAASRDDLTLAFSAALADAGVHMLRVHNVGRHIELFRRLEAH